MFRQNIEGTTLPILIDTLFRIRYSSIETEASQLAGQFIKGTPIMDENTIIEQLEELIKSFNIQIRYEPIKQDEDLVKVVGGLCILRGKYVLIIDSKAAVIDKIRTFAEALRHFDLDQIYIKPVVRELLDKIPPHHILVTTKEESQV